MKSKEMQDKAMLRWYYLCVFGMPYMGLGYHYYYYYYRLLFSPIVGCLLLPVELYLLS